MTDTYANALATRRRQHGLTLVEIMVAITISLVLLAGVIQIFASNKASYQLQSNVGRLHENARYALDIMTRNIAMAGYTSSETTILDAFVMANTLDNATPNADLGFTVASGRASDTVSVQYESATDCLGNATGGTAIDRYYINGTDLMCLGNGSVTPGILAEGIENMQILYGEDSDSDHIANRYISAGNITAANPIKAVRIALLASTVDNVGATDTGVYALLNAPPIGPINDRLVRKVFTQTILTRNPATPP